MNTVNNYQSPNFGMALKIKNAEGLKKYINGMPERIEEVAKYGADARKADKKLIRTMENELKEAGVTKEDIGEIERYIPDTVIRENGTVVTDSKRFVREYNSLTDAAGNGLCSYYDMALKYFRNDLQGIIQKREEAAKEARIDKAVGDLMAKFGE